MEISECAFLKASVMDHNREVFKGNMKGNAGSAGTPSVGKAEDAPTPRCSTDTTDTLFNLDISSNIPKILFPMDAEDSPWGGM